MDGKDKTNHKAYSKGQYIGDYQVIDSIEEGRFAYIYLAQSQSRQVRVEVLRPPLTSGVREDFLAQARALMDMEHPHILHLRDAGVDNSNPFLVTDYVPYLTLRQVYQSGGGRPLANLLPYLKQIAEALDALHSKNILHGDIRPENILLDRNNNVLLWGFRIEAIEQNRERLNFHKVEAMRDAIAYTAPERIQGKPLPASDQYSLAIIIYEFLSGTVPFTGSYIEIADKQVQAVPPLLREKGVASRIEQIVMRALSKDAKKRYTNTDLFIRALETEVLREQGISVPPRKVPPPVQPIDVSLRQSGTAPAQPPPAAQRPAPIPNPAPAAFNAPQAARRESTVQAPSQPQSFVPVAPPPAQELPQSALAPRRGDANKVSRRIFAVGLVAVAALGGAGGWYALSKKLTPPAVPTITPNEPPPATQTTVNNTNALIFTGHLAAVNAVSWSPDGTLLASGSDDTYVQIFEASTGKRRVIYTGHTKEVAAVAWSPNGRLIASAGQDGTVQIWNAANGAKILTYKGHSNRVNSVAWSTDGLFIASGSEDKTVQVWSSSTGNRFFNFVGHTAGVLCVEWQPNNSSVASGSWDGTLRDWATVPHGNHFAAGEQIFNYGGHAPGAVPGLTWAPNGTLIASAGTDDQTVQISIVSDIKNGGTPIPPFFTDHRDPKQVNPVRAVDWSPGGSDIVSGDAEGKVLVWHVAGRKTFFTYRGHKKAVNSVAWAPDGKRVASASTDATVHIWQPA